MHMLWYVDVRDLALKYVHKANAFSEQGSDPTVQVYMGP